MTNHHWLTKIDHNVCEKELFAVRSSLYNLIRKKLFKQNLSSLPSLLKSGYIIIIIIMAEMCHFLVLSFPLFIAVVLQRTNASVISKLLKNVKASGLTQTLEQPLPSNCSHLTSTDDKFQPQFGSDPGFLSQISSFLSVSGRTELQASTVHSALIYFLDSASQRRLMANDSTANRCLRVMRILLKCHF